MKRLSNLFFVLCLLLTTACAQTSSVVDATTFGFNPNSSADGALAAKQLIEHLQARTDTSHVVVQFAKGTYHIYPDSAFVREYYVSNHDQDNPKTVGFALEDLQNITIDGQGSEFIFHGRMIPFAMVRCQNVTLKNLSVDFALPAFRQLTILSVDKANDQVEAQIYPAGAHRVEQQNRLVAVGEGYENPLFVSMGFREDKRLTYQRGDISFDAKTIEMVGNDKLIINGWSQLNHVSVGERYALRSYHRPTPGIFVSESKDMAFDSVTVHYAEGMGLLAQMTENITLTGFNVCLRENDPRYFTTQADATHFSACKGVITSIGGLYEGMADDAINVHGTYLRVTKRVNSNTIQATYMHPQAFGFKWGEEGDSVQFYTSERMEIVRDTFLTTIKTIQPVGQAVVDGAKVFEIVFQDNIPDEISEQGKFGVENLTWTPRVVFAQNIIRNNRARGALFSTPRQVECLDNTFDHTHGTAILLCGDCNGWYETGACRNVLIKGNTFTNALTANYQFTNAVISIYPEIPDLANQQQFFHSGIVIEDNLFEMFDKPLVYAKSVDGLVFRNNKVTTNSEFAPYHWNKHPFFFERVADVVIENNQFEQPFDAAADVRVELSATDAVTINP